MFSAPRFLPSNSRGPGADAMPEAGPTPDDDSRHRDGADGVGVPLADAADSLRAEGFPEPQRFAPPYRGRAGPPLPNAAISIASRHPQAAAHPCGFVQLGVLSAHMHCRICVSEAVAPTVPAQVRLRRDLGGVRSLSPSGRAPATPGGRASVHDSDAPVARPCCPKKMSGASHDLEADVHSLKAATAGEVPDTGLDCMPTSVETPPTTGSRHARRDPLHGHRYDGQGRLSHGPRRCRRSWTDRLNHAEGVGQTIDATGALSRPAYAITRCVRISSQPRERRV